MRAESSTSGMVLQGFVDEERRSHRVSEDFWDAGEASCAGRTLPPYLKKNEVRRQIRKMAWEKVKAIHLAKESRRWKRRLQKESSRQAKKTMKTDSKTTSTRRARKGVRERLKKRSPSSSSVVEEEAEKKIKARSKAGRAEAGEAQMPKLCSKSSFLKSLLGQ
eukprot:764027-Hanusia_phi.AAC.11